MISPIQSLSKKSAHRTIEKKREGERKREFREKLDVENVLSFYSSI